MVKTGDYKVWFENVTFSQPLVYWNTIPNVPYIFTTYFHDIGDRRSDEFFWFKYGPLPLLAMLSAYLLFVTRIGPNNMKNRQPLNIKPVIITYNFIMVLLNLRFFVLSLYFLDAGRDLFKADILTSDRDDYTPDTMYEIWNGNFYYWTKFADLLDTVFFVLRKKQSHITTLHLYHHTVVPLLGWPLFRVLAHARPIGLFIMFNSMIHTIMYAYYGLAAIGPQMRKFLWWKKYITQLQLAQFVVYEAYCLYCFFRFRPDWPQWVYNMGYIVLWAQPIIFFSLFYNFYVRNYVKPAAKKDLTNGHTRLLTNGHSKAE